MTEKEIIAGLASVGSKHPALLAVQAILDDAVQQEQDGVAIPNLTDGARHFNAGRLAHAKDLRDAFAGLRTKADQDLTTDGHG